MTPLERIAETLAPRRERLLNHPLHARLDTLPALRTFLEHHAFAVWDFMSLLKSLQRALTCVDVPWTPRRDVPGEVGRLINEIVLGEESDEDGDDGFSSHFDLYRDAMRQAGADATALDRFVSLVSDGTPVDRALERSHAPAPAAAFVRSTFALIDPGSLPAIASAFALGREDLIPRLFVAVVEGVGRRHPGTLDRFLHYLDRHIELDGDHHAGMAGRMLQALCGDDPECWAEAESAALAAMDARLALWDGILAALPQRRQSG